MFDISKLTLGEVAKIEELSEQSITVLGDDNTPKGKMLAAICLVQKRRQQMAAGEPAKFTWNEAMSLPFDEAQVILNGGEAISEPEVDDRTVTDPPREIESPSDPEDFDKNE